jgi:hypothetical protein
VMLCRASSRWISCSTQHKKVEAHSMTTVNIVDGLVARRLYAAETGRCQSSVWRTVVHSDSDCESQHAPVSPCLCESWLDISCKYQGVLPVS